MAMVRVAHSYVLSDIPGKTLINAVHRAFPIEWFLTNNPAENTVNQFANEVQ